MSQYVFLRLLEMRGTKKNLPIIDISGRILILLRRVQLTNLYNNSNFDNSQNIKLEQIFKLIYTLWISNGQTPSILINHTEISCTIA